MKLFTIGFTQKSAEDFFNLLKNNKVKILIDVRLNNVSQLAGFTKKRDLEYFLKEICQIKYVHYDFLAPTKEILNDFKKKKITWKQYEERFLALLNDREAISKIENNQLDYACLLCSESSAEMCHRTLLGKNWGI